MTGWLYGYTAVWLYGCMAVRTYYIIIIIMRVGRSTEKATDDVIGPARKLEDTNSNAARVSGPVGPRLLSLATMCYVLFVAISLMLIAPTWSNESTKRPAVDSSTTVAPLGHLCSCSNRSPYHPSLVPVSFFAPYPIPYDFTLHDDPHDPRPPFTLSRLPTAPQRSTTNRATVSRRQLRWRVTINPQDSA